MRSQEFTMRGYGGVWGQNLQLPEAIGSLGAKPSAAECWR